MNKIEIEIPMLKKWRSRIIFSFNVWDFSVPSDDMVGIYFCAWLVKRSYALATIGGIGLQSHCL